MSTLETVERDPLDVRYSRRARGLLAAFNEAGVLSAADVQVASRLCELGGETNEHVALALALAVRSPRLGHVLVDLDRIHQTAALDREAPVDLAALPWPEPRAWAVAVAGSPLVAVGDDTNERAADTPPFRLLGSWLYLDRYLADEREVARALRERAAAAAPGFDAALLANGIARLFPDAGAEDRQRAAAELAVRRRLTVIAGGPGTGKTTTVARVAALVVEQALRHTGRAPLIALAAPTGKAAVRLEEAVHAEAASLDVDPAVRDALMALHGSTLHRLLGHRPDSDSRFRHDRDRRLPHDVVVVDETSMVPLSLMARLLEAVRPQARLVLLGDPNQLASIEAGAVLGDIVGPAADPAAAEGATRPRANIADQIVVLERVHRYGGALATLAEAVRAGDADATLSLLERGGGGIEWVREDLAPVQDTALEAARAVLAAAQAGEAARALACLAQFRLLCAHRREVGRWRCEIEGLLAASAPDLARGERFYAGRPLLVTENDYELGLFNGDTGVVVARADESRMAVFERAGSVVEYSPSRLGAIDTVFAMTIHKSQGSQFDVAALVLPDEDSRILTRELLYTALTRARRRLIVAGSADTIRAAVERPIARASGLRARLWEDDVTRA